MIKILKNKAFTLAEVLIVLGIIGIVATLTIPNLNSTADEGVYVAKAKKTYTELSSAWDRLALKEVPNLTSQANITVQLNHYLKTKSSGSANCPSIYGDSGKEYCTLLSDGATYVVTDGSTIQTSSGVIIIFDSDGPKKGPNTQGIDIFLCGVAKSSVGDSSLQPCSTGSCVISKTTQPTAATYLQWVMLYDNMDYMNCASNLYFANVTSCN